MSYDLPSSQEMKTLARIIGTVFLTVVLVGTLSAIIIKDAPTAQSNGSDIVISWRTVDETGVQRFEILRRAVRQGDFLTIGIVDQLKGNNSSYNFTDKSAFKTTGTLYQVQNPDHQRSKPGSRDSYRDGLAPQFRCKEDVGQHQSNVPLSCSS